MSDSTYTGDEGQFNSRARVDNLLMRLLSQVQLFNNFHRNDILELLQVMEKREFSAGEYIFYEGDPGESMYILIAGEVQVLKGVLKRQITEIARLTPGESFGEMSLIENKPRSASVVALNNCTVLKLRRQNLTPIPNVAAKLHFNIAKLLATRLRGVNELILSLKR